MARLLLPCLWFPIAVNIKFSTEFSSFRPELKQYRLISLNWNFSYSLWLHLFPIWCTFWRHTLFPKQTLLIMRFYPLRVCSFFKPSPFPLLTAYPNLSSSRPQFKFPFWNQVLCDWPQPREISHSLNLLSSCCLYGSLSKSSCIYFIYTSNFLNNHVYFLLSFHFFFLLSPLPQIRL